MTEKRKLTAEEFYRCAEAVKAVQGSCLHRHQTSSSGWFGEKLVTIYQCNDCAMYNPGKFGFEPPQS